MKQYALLLIDDEESILLGLAKYFKKEGYRVSTASSGEEGIKKFKESYFDLIITDIMMDGLDGIEVLKQAKEIRPDVLVMMLTGYGSLNTAVDALRLGAFDYMQKPCNKDELLMRTQRCVDHLVLNRKIKIYEKFLPVCCVCKKIRDDTNREPGTGPWLEPDLYLAKRTEAETSHGYCDEHTEELKKEIEATLKNRKRI
jgi:YesN/AraC family two-component response regulator